jgi:pimeloyl-ACP methyl ester carboxylesterase
VLFKHTIIDNNTSNWIICFCGYGQSSSIFLPLNSKLDYNCNFVLIDYNVENVHAISKQAFANYIEELCKQYAIQKTSIISFSLGGRYNLCLLELLPQYITQSIAIAPDGVVINSWNKIAMNTTVGNSIFKYLVYHPTIYLKLINILYALKLLPKSVFTFIKWTMRDVENRKKVYTSWMQTKYIKPDLDIVANNCKKYTITLTCILGEKDVIIKPVVGEKLIKKCPMAKCIKIDVDHNMLNENLYNQLALLLCC